MTSRLHAALLASLCLTASVTAAPKARPPGGVVRVDHYDPQAMPAKGPAHAMVTVELFFAPQTNYSVRLPAYRQLEALQQKHPTRMRLVYRVVQRSAQPPGPQLPTLALEAYAQGKFAEFIAAIHNERTTLTREKMLELARKVGMDAARAERAITDDRYRDVINANEHRMDRLRVTTAPVVFFNGKPVRTSASSTSDADYENAYQEAYDRARELVDKGVDPRDLMRVFESQVRDAGPPVAIPIGSADEDFVGDPTEHPLASPPLTLTGLPSLAAPDARAPVSLVLLCRPNDTSCNGTMRILRKTADMFRGEVRVVWAPWFDVMREDAAELTLLGDAALCAEQLASSPDDFDATPGWQWVVEAYGHIARQHGRRVPPDKLIDSVAAKLRIDPAAMSACRARMAKTTLDWIASARRSGVTASPALIIGGRIYPGLNEEKTINQLVEAELAPGVLERCATSGC
ncbi:MAG: DsbA family protein [Kofleriaceae bacterium]|nr:DsbA family protein [Kofleriaceae bacterium]